MSISVTQKISWLLASIYIFVVCFGGFFRFGDAESALGVSTTIFVFIVLLNLPRLALSLFKDPLISVFVVLCFCAALGSIFNVGSTAKSLLGSGTFLLYIIFAASFASMDINSKMLKVFVFAAASGIFISSFITLVDYFGVYNFPGVNEKYIASKVTGEEVEQAGGFFARRSAMAAYFALIIPFVFVCKNATASRLYSLACLLTVCLGMLTLFLTHNRSGVLGVVVSIALFYMLDRKFSFSSRSMKVFLFGLSGIVLLAALTYFLPEHFGVYANKFGRLLPGGEQYISDSDYARVYFFLEALKGLPSNPIGHGFGLMYTERYGFYSPHNIFTYIIYSTGIFSFFWFVIAAYQLIKKMKIVRNLRYIDDQSYYISMGVFVGIVAWVINNMAHNSFSTGVFWMFLGLMVSFSNYTKGCFRNADKRARQ